MPTKKSKTETDSKNEPQPLRRRLVGIFFGPHSIIGRYEEVWATADGLRTTLRYGKSVSFNDNPEIASTARAASILMDELSNTIRNVDKHSKPELSEL